MTDREAIEHLKTTAPRVELTRWQRVARVGSVVFAGVAVMALAVSVYATRQAWGVASCLNSILGDRAAPTSADNQAHIDFAKSLDRAFAAKPKTAAERAAVTATFKASVGAYLTVLVTDQQIRDAHPLGKC